MIDFIYNPIFRLITKAEGGCILTKCLLPQSFFVWRFIAHWLCAALITVVIISGCIIGRLSNFGVLIIRDHRDEPLGKFACGAAVAAVFNIEVAYHAENYCSDKVDKHIFDRIIQTYVKIAVDRQCVSVYGN